VSAVVYNLQPLLNPRQGTYWNMASYIPEQGPYFLVASNKEKKKV
jgi:hypothetical protein